MGGRIGMGTIRRTLLGTRWMGVRSTITLWLRLRVWWVCVMGRCGVMILRFVRRWRLWVPWLLGIRCTLIRCVGWCSMLLFALRFRLMVFGLLLLMSCWRVVGLLGLRGCVLLRWWRRRRLWLLRRCGGCVPLFVIFPIIRILRRPVLLIGRLLLGRLRRRVRITIFTM